jgi:hypothetical protein
MKQLEAENQKYRAEAAEAVAAKRELAFIKVGIDVDSPTGKLFAKAYDGETSPEAVAAAAAEYGLIKPPSKVNADEQEQRAWSSASMSQASGAPAPAAGDIRDGLDEAKIGAVITAVTPFAESLNRAGDPPAPSSSAPRDTLAD